ncbi:MAG TPA: Gfo/Idh/MocA family oxidoreductase [Candidatus Limnocylindrales bacterium]|nr:Gfo/Idh/MocA family oxidoreductase [Candidatus Limnocylindrales bacterium]
MQLRAPVRLGFSGTGYIARIHAKAATTLGYRVASVANHRPDGARAFAELFGAETIHDSVTELVAAGGVDGIVVCTPNAQHAPDAIAALDAGVPVLVEKPMAMDAAEALSMQRASERTGTPLMVAHCWRFDAETRWLRSRIEDGALGSLLRTKGYGVHVDWGPQGWFTQRALAGGGALVDMGIHALDTARFLIGDPHPASVYARIATHYRDVDVDDTGLVVVTWDDGSVSTIESGWWQPHAEGPEAATQLYGTEGYGRLFPTMLKRSGEEPEEPGFAFPREPHCLPAMYEAQLEAFATSIATGRVAQSGPGIGVENARILDAAYESARTGQAIPLAVR